MTQRQKVVVVTDSAAVLPRELIQSFRIFRVPHLLIFEGREYRDGEDLEPGTFYQMLKKARYLPKTAAPRPQSFLEKFHQASQEAPSILCLTLSSRFSSTYQSALSAAEMARESLPEVSIEVMDSGTAAGAQGLVVLEAARRAMEGQDLPQVVQAAQRVMRQVRLVAVLDTLYYLWKGGRVPKVAAWAGSLLSLKPIFELRDAEVYPLERPRTKAKAMERMLEIMRRYCGQRAIHVNVTHAQVPEEAECLRKKVAASFNCVELLVSEFTPVIGAHTGPGLLTLDFYPDDRGVL